MNSFCVEKLSLPARLRPLHGVVQAEAFVVTGDAQRAAALLLKEARATAAALLEEAQATAAAAMRREQQRVAQESTVLLQGLRQAQENLLDRVGALAIELAGQAFERLVVDAAPAERIAAAVRRVREEAPSRLSEAVAWVHPDDQALIGDCPWELRTDARLERGACRLEASSGEWRADFTLAATALQDALTAQQALFAPPEESIAGQQTSPEEQPHMPAHPDNQQENNAANGADLESGRRKRTKHDGADGR